MIKPTQGSEEPIDELSLDPPFHARVLSLLRLIDAYTFEIDVVTKRVTGTLARHGGFKAIQAIPGVGPVLAAVFVAAPSDKAALDLFAEFSDKWERRYPTIIRLWTDAWAEFVPFLEFDIEIRKIICATNAIESINARLRRAVNARGHFPNEQAALKCLYMALMGLDPTGRGRGRGQWTMRWKAALNAFDVRFEGRLSLGRI